MVEKQEIHDKFYRVYKREMGINNFEEWLYNHTEIEEMLTPKVYYELISVKFNDKHAYEDIIKILLNHIDLGAYEKKRIEWLLFDLIDHEDDLVNMTTSIYDDYCRGYTFLRYIALMFILTADHDDNGVYGNQKKLKAYYNKFVMEANRILGFLDSYEIVITGEYEYEDNRSF